MISIRRFLLSAFCFLHFLLFSQNNRLTNENGQLLWQYTQNITFEKGKPDRFLVTFVFINGIKQTAISLRQELFYSIIEWVETGGEIVEKEERVDFLTINLSPHKSVVWKYMVKNKTTGKEPVVEKSAVLIINEEFEVRKELLPEQKKEK